MQPKDVVRHFKYVDLVDTPKLQRLMEGFSEVLGTANAIVDGQGTVIVQSGWQEACTNFHRANPHACRRCHTSGTLLAEALAEGQPFAISRCGNGLFETASPIIVDGENVANIRTGQFLTRPPDYRFFRMQAKQFSFEEADYLDAISKVPIVSRDQVEAVTRLFARLAEMLADSGLDRLRARLAKEELEQEIGERKLAETRAVDFGTRLKAMTRRYAVAQESENRRLARELHDRVSSSLTAIGLNLGLIERQLPQAAATKSVIDLLSNSMVLVQETMLNAREISHDLHPAVLDYCGVPAAVEDYVRRNLSQTDITVEVEWTDRNIRLSPDQEIALYRIAVEAITNCVKHSRAMHIKVEFVGDAEHTKIAIVDDGIGFDRTKQPTFGSPFGLGILSMQERAEAIGGQLTLKSSPGQGTRITVEI